MASVVAVGELMVELSGLKADGQAYIGVGGDTGNTAVYLKRLFGDEGRIGYLTRLGQGAFAEKIAQFLKDERVELSSSAQNDAGTPGLYAISTDEVGERSFSYWRTEAPVRQLFCGKNAIHEIAFADEFDALYISGISLAVLSEQGRAAMLTLAEKFRVSGRVVMFDVNYRPHLWASHAPEIDVPSAMADMIRRASIVKIGRDEGEALWGHKTSREVARFVRDMGADGVVVTDGAAHLDLDFGKGNEMVEFEPVQTVIDSTAAGDSFSAGFLHSWLEGRAPKDCAHAAHRLASCVIQHRGAIIPLKEMPA